MKFLDKRIKRITEGFRKEFNLKCLCSTYDKKRRASLNHLGIEYRVEVYLFKVFGYRYFLPNLWINIRKVDIDE